MAWISALRCDSAGGGDFPARRALTRVRPKPHSDRPDDYARIYVEELVRTGVILTDLLGGLVESMREEEFPGETRGAVLIEMLVGSLRPVTEAAGEATVRRATALLGACVDRTVADLRLALDIAEAGESN
jgi:hypothetical protein